MKDLEQRQKLHMVEKEIIVYFLSVCKKLELSYTMLGGTFLGAVRHKGFIPWDDDVDFGLQRNDYEKLVTYLIDHPNEIFPFKNFLNSDIKTYFSRIESKKAIIIDTSANKTDKRNAWIDIFPLDGMPNEKLSRQMHEINLLRLRMLLQYSQFSKIVNTSLTERPLIEKILINFGKLIKPERFLNKDHLTRKLDYSLKKYDVEKSKNLVNFMGAYKFKEMFPRSVYEDLQEYQFEDIKLLGPVAADKYLSSLYGNNYMQPPSDMVKNKHFTKIVINK